ncbi:MAG TPA: nucleoside 2-deoxyribosyltransferase [Magnetospirillum sp.]|nr:nucleoside 2-deoxyribosyltransferase [Magnetospirillum sp.]
METGGGSATIGGHTAFRERTMSNKVYLAGPAVFHPAAKQVFEYLVEECGKHGLEAITPEIGDLELSSFTLPEQAARIRALNVSKIRQADAVIACISPFRGPGADAGTAWEMGYAEALGKPVVAWCEETGDYRSRVASDVDPKGTWWCRQHGMIVEDFGLVDNLMLTAGAHPVQPDFDAACKLARELLGL